MTSYKLLVVALNAICALTDTFQLYGISLWFSISMRSSKNSNKIQDIAAWIDFRVLLTARTQRLPNPFFNGFSEGALFYLTSMSLVKLEQPVHRLNGSAETVQRDWWFSTCGGAEILMNDHMVHS